MEASAGDRRVKASPSRLPARALSGLRMPLTSVPGAGMALYCHQSSSLASTRRGTFREILGIPWLVFPVFRTWHSHGWGLGSVPGWGTEILQASQHGHERKKKKKKGKKNSSKDITWCSISETVISNMQVDKGLAHVHRTPVHQEKENVNMDQDLSRHVTRE